MSSKQLAACLPLIHQRVSGLFIKSPHIDWFIFLQGDRCVCSSASTEYRVQGDPVSVHTSLAGKGDSEIEHLLAGPSVAAAVHSCGDGV